MSRYNINFSNFIKKLLPPFLRGSRMLDWLKALIKPLQTLNTKFNEFMQRIRYKIGFNGQVVYLEHILNDYYDNTLRRIYITDGSSIPLPPYIYNKIENRVQYLYNKSEAEPPLYAYNKSEYNTSVDFIVNVPAAILTAQLSQQIRALVNQYRIAGKRFAVVPF